MAHIGDGMAYPCKYRGAGERRVICGHINIGAAGAVSSLTDMPDCTAANGGTGVFSLTFPPAARGSIQLTLESAAGTVKTVWLTARSMTAGTATIATGNGGGTATNPASGDIIHVKIIGQKNSAT